MTALVGSLEASWRAASSWVQGRWVKETLAESIEVTETLADCVEVTETLVDCVEVMETLADCVEVTETLGDCVEVIEISAAGIEVGCHRCLCYWSSACVDSLTPPTGNIHT